MLEVTGATPERFGNTAHIAAAAYTKAGLDPADWKPGMPYPEDYIVYAVSEGETCKFCDALKAELQTLAEQKKLTFTVKRLTRQERVELYDSLGLTDGQRVVPQVALFDRRSGRPQHIGNRQEFQRWLEIMNSDAF